MVMERAYGCGSLGRQAEAAEDLGVGGGPEGACRLLDLIPGYGEGVLEVCQLLGTHDDRCRMPAARGDDGALCVNSSLLHEQPEALLGLLDRRWCHALEGRPDLRSPIGGTGRCRHASRP